MVLIKTQAAERFLFEHSRDWAFQLQRNDYYMLFHISDVIPEMAYSSQVRTVKKRPVMRS